MSLSREEKSISIGICSYHGEKLVARCVKSIFKSSYVGGFNIELIVVADGGLTRDLNLPITSTKACSKVKVDTLDEQRGNVHCYNRIIDNASNDTVILLDNDVIVPDRWLWSMIYFLKSNKCGVASFKSTRVTNDEMNKLMEKEVIENVGSTRVPDRATELAGQCFGFKKSVIGNTRFDDSNFKYFLGDSDFCCQLAQKGLPSYRILFPEVYHIEHYTYDRFPELKADRQATTDVANFQEKWGSPAYVIEEKLLAKIPAQQITWLTTYGFKYSIDAEKTNMMSPGRTIIKNYQEKEKTK